MDSIEKRFTDLDDPSRTGYLIGCFITGTLTIEEREELDAWVIDSEENMQLFEDMTDERQVDEFTKWLATRETEAKLSQVKKRIAFTPRRRSFAIWQYAVAAGIFCVIAFMLYVLFEGGGKQPVEKIIVSTDIPAGSDVAFLRMADGTIVSLDGILDTTLGNIHINDGEIAYSQGSSEMGFHEVSVPRKGSYKLLLPDGTRVWLNSESSIRYPANFPIDKRVVTVTGETYFEVARDPSRPFSAKINGREVKAIGTAFNINGFDGKVTLTEGKVSVTEDIRFTLLNPGEQLDNSFRKTNIDINPVTAWTRNQFVFKNATIKDIMKSLMRWYDCEVIFEDDITYHFNGTIERTVPISRVLQLLEGTGHVQFKIENNTVTVKK